MGLSVIATDMSANTEWNELDTSGKFNIVVGCLAMLGGALCMAFDQLGNRVAIFMWVMLSSVHQALPDENALVKFILQLGIFVFVAAQAYSVYTERCAKQTKETSESSCSE